MIIIRATSVAQDIPRVIMTTREICNCLDKMGSMDEDFGSIGVN